MKLSDILKDTNYKLTQFSDEQIRQLEDAITYKESNGKKIVLFVKKK
ncbi:MAG TPA: hypothetical protein VIJ75_15870 [Hanamia sp.]